MDDTRSAQPPLGGPPGLVVDLEPMDVIDQAGVESFPASDPPSWDPLHAGAPHDVPPRREERPSDASRNRRRG